MKRKSFYIFMQNWAIVHNNYFIIQNYFRIVNISGSFSVIKIVFS